MQFPLSGRFFDLANEMLLSRCSYRDAELLRTGFELPLDVGLLSTALITECQFTFHSSGCVCLAITRSLLIATGPRTSIALGGDSGDRPIYTKYEHLDFDEGFAVAEKNVSSASDLPKIRRRITELRARCGNSASLDRCRCQKCENTERQETDSQPPQSFSAHDSSR